jgi:hypothetical protein
VKNEALNDYYTNDYLRASVYIKQIWEKVEQDIVYMSGISDSLIVSIFADDEVIQLIATNEAGVVKSTRHIQNIDHVLSKSLFVELNIHININVSNTDDFKFTVDNCRFYFIEDNFVFNKDNGEVKANFDTTFSLKNFVSVKERILSEVSYETQYCIQYNLLPGKKEYSDFNSDTLHYDALYESIKNFYVNENYSFKQKAMMLLTQNYMSLKDYKNILKLNSKVQVAKNKI